MSTSRRSRIVDAMYELKERRDAGEPVHEIITEVAEEYRVDVDELRGRAQSSWGAPLETDRQRHAEHFEFADSANEISTQARELAKMIFDLNLPYVREHRFWEVNWNREIDLALEKVKLNNPVLEQVARKEFLSTSEHYEAILAKFRTHDA